MVVEGARGKGRARLRGCRHGQGATAESLRRWQRYTAARHETVKAVESERTDKAEYKIRATIVKAQVRFACNRIV